ncbi:MAG: hypothetical protein II975_08045 [Bacteroidales bacterium]|nr:hypothetical protein [Bacteroidales bacterium]
MKKNILLTLFLFGGVAVFAQDTIVFCNGNELRVKVNKVKDDEIEYHLWDNLSGPVYVKKVSDILELRYKGGYKDVFGVQQDVASLHVVKDTALSMYGGKRMYASRGYLYIDDYGKIGKNDLPKILTKDEYCTYESSVRQEALGVSLTFSGIIIDVVGLIFLLEKKDYAVGVSLTATGNAMHMVGVPFWVIGSCRMRWVASSYNYRMSNESLSLSVTPSLMTGPDKYGNNRYGYGVGLTLNF